MTVGASTCDESPAFGSVAQDQPLDDRLSDYVERTLERPDFPAFSAQIDQIMALFLDEDVSILKLGEMSSRDYGLTLKLLQAANAVGRTLRGVPIFSVEGAIFRLGVDRVRAIAGGMVFFEHFSRQSQTVKGLVRLSLMTAHQCEAAAT